MVKAEWGKKRVCSSCKSKFYDLLRNPAVCPSCGTEFNPESIVKSRRGRPPLSELAKKSQIANVVVEDDEIDILGDIDNYDIIAEDEIDDEDGVLTPDLKSDE